ncbi:hypothetical protein [Kandleria vitulina]|nr:hypothetical protein [Kandleria vitulina]
MEIRSSNETRRSRMARSLISSLSSVREISIACLKNYVRYTGISHEEI